MSEHIEGVIFQCPYCGEDISMALERFSGGQSYIEDCEVCCRPIEIDYTVIDGEISLQQVRKLDD
jgi:hypothetical protein